MFSNNPMMIQTPGAELDEMTEIIAEINNTAALIRIILILSGAISLLTSISAIGLLKFKRWGLILFHSSTLIILLGILFGVVYYTLTIEPFNGLNSTEAFDMAINQHFRNTQKFYTISYGVFFLLIAWIITRINILFSKKNYRVEFHP